ncbi:V [Bat mastadenovirus G]|uniref:V n=1 Tax=Bat mastadenovirus G TaxID=2015376 RepID=A0A1J0FAQ4_9ADEN|nr:V [Bat mastadenovirus G] [Bat mastadenovirus G]APC26064.1 V [Bat mastadenovirus G] [Bat mastadenovirus G]
MAALSRAIKQELLEDLKPEIYVAPRRRARVKTEEKVDVKTLVKARSKKRRAAKQELEEDVEFVRKFAPRRPYQWKGRKVQAVVRPGVPVVFTPGQRVGKAIKRDYDEVHADEDILEQAGVMINEFAYGKRAKLLTERNPTPSQVPITPQEPVVRPGEAKLLPTVQVLVPRDVKKEAVLPVGKSEAGDVKIENKGLEQVAPGLAVQTVDIKVPIKRKMADDGVVVKKLKEEIEEEFKPTIKMEYSEGPVAELVRPKAVARKRRQPAPPVEVMEVQSMAAPPAPAAVVQPAPAMPMAVEVTTPVRRVSRWGPANAIFPEYRYHPSITAAKIRGPAPRGRVSRWGPANSIIPEVRLHPSMVGAVTRGAPRRRRRTRQTRRRGRLTRRGALIPTDVRYHPSITLLSRRV